MSMMNQTAPIVVFDSGFGGISVLKKLVAAMPNENLLYYGDSANAPYGPRTKEKVCELTVDAIRSLLPQHPKAVVIACNTATAASEEAVRELCSDIPVIGICPAVKQAEAAGCRRILTLATQGTLASESYANQLKEISPETEVLSIAAPGIVKYVESEMSDQKEIFEYLSELLTPARENPVDAVVLGCTHFPFAKDVVRSVLGYDVRFFDASVDVAEKTKCELEQRGTRETREDSGSITFMNSLHQKSTIGFSWSLFAREC